MDGADFHTYYRNPTSRVKVVNSKGPVGGDDREVSRSRWTVATIATRLSSLQCGRSKLCCYEKSEIQEISWLAIVPRKRTLFTFHNPL